VARVGSGAMASWSLFETRKTFASAETPEGIARALGTTLAGASSKMGDLTSRG
jgi:hypothetical protein